MDMARFMTNWIWTPEWTDTDNMQPGIVYFRKVLSLEEIPEKTDIRITADSRYKLYVNGLFVQKGPQKALDLREWYVDSAVLGPYLKTGENTIAVEVLRYPAYNGSTSHPNANDSLLRTETPHLYIDGGMFSTKTGWKCCVNREIRIVGENERPAPIHAQEEVTATAAFAHWKTAAYDDSAWADALPKLYFDMPMADAPGNLTPRTIPDMEYVYKRFETVSAVREGGQIRDQWNMLIEKDIPLEIPSHSTQVVELSAGAEECGYLLYALKGGGGTEITTLCSECYAYPQPPKPTMTGSMIPSHPKKGDRTDAVHGQLFGHTSVYRTAGYGTDACPEEYEPFAFRTFRYVQLKIETGDAPLTILRFCYRATGYPLLEKTRFTVSDPGFAPVWDISLRTLRRCMHETYMDCPFYEQLQYAMDGRNEILYTYAVSADDRLARQAMEAFRRSQRPDGMVNADAPTIKSNVIPGFSIYYLLMVHDHMMYFGDRELVRRHLPAIDGVLGFFDRSLNDLGMVGRVGGKTMRHKYWSFIDWSDQFEFGTPKASELGCGSVTMESLLYLYGLQHAAELADFAGRPGLAEEYRSRAVSLKEAVVSNCMGVFRGQKLVQDGPGAEEYSVHCQVFAVLTGVVPREEGKAMLQATVGSPEFAQSSVSFMFYLFRALELCGWYEKTDELWNLWRKMVENNLTTCVENDTDERSDCHAWASLMCYELPAVILGVRPAAPGFTRVQIAPQMGRLSYAQGDVITPKGFVHVEWHRDAEGNCNLEYTLPDGILAL